MKFEIMKIDNSRKVNEINAKVQLIKETKIFKAYKFNLKMIKNDIKYNNKKIKDFREMSELIGMIQPGQNMYLFSNLFDAPNLLLYFDSIFTIEEIYISTWAITDKGLSTVKYFNDKNIPLFLLLDKTYSYKWIFQSGAIDYLKNIQLRFTENHSKILLLKTENQYICILGSMNFTNNPRIENINIISNMEIYNFFKEQLNKFYEPEKTGTYIGGNLFESTTEFIEIN
jgi:hypothetical protein